MIVTIEVKIHTDAPPQSPNRVSASLALVLARRAFGETIVHSLDTLTPSNALTEQIGIAQVNLSGLSYYLQGKVED